MPRKKKIIEPAAQTAQIEKHRDDLRRPFLEQFEKVKNYIERLTSLRIGFLLTNVYLTNEFALHLDAAASLRAAQLFPELFRDDDNLKFGKTVYFKYEFEVTIEKRAGADRA